MTRNESTQATTIKDGTKIGDMCYYEKFSNWRHCNGIDSWDSTVASSSNIPKNIIPPTAGGKTSNSQCFDEKKRAWYACGAPIEADPTTSVSTTTEFNKKLSRDLNDTGISYINENNFPDAVTTLRLASNASPNDAEILGNLGYALYMNGDTLQAKEALLKSLHIKPKRGSTWNNIGLVLAKLGHTAQATNCFINYYDYSSQKKTAESMLFAWRDRGDTQSLRDAASAAIDKLALANP